MTTLLFSVSLLWNCNFSKTGPLIVIMYKCVFALLNFGSDARDNAVLFNCRLRYAGSPANNSKRELSPRDLVPENKLKLLLQCERVSYAKKN